MAYRWGMGNAPSFSSGYRASPLGDRREIPYRSGRMPSELEDYESVPSEYSRPRKDRTIPVAARRGAGYLPDRKSESNGNIIDTSSFAYYEDVAAELEDFMLFSRLGLTEIALSIIEQVLWQHLHIFQVIAEVSTWLFRQGHDLTLQQALQQSARGPSQRQFSAEENNLLLTITPKVPGGKQAKVSNYSTVGEPLIMRSRALTEIEIHQGELDFLIAARTANARRTTDSILLARQCQRLVTASLEDDLIQTATLLFTSACNSCSGMGHAQRTARKGAYRDDLHLLLDVYYELTPKLASYSFEQDKGHRSKNVVPMICDLEAKAALHLLIKSVPEERRALGDVTDSLANDITMLLDCLFFELPGLRTKSTYNDLFPVRKGTSPAPSLAQTRIKAQPGQSGRQTCDRCQIDNANCTGKQPCGRCTNMQTSCRYTASPPVPVTQKPSAVNPSERPLSIQRGNSKTKVGPESSDNPQNAPEDELEDDSEVAPRLIRTTRRGSPLNEPPRISPRNRLDRDDLEDDRVPDVTSHTTPLYPPTRHERDRQSGRR